MALSVPINMKASPELRDLIDRAANLQHRNRTEFVLDAARQRAEEVILEEQIISLSSDQYERFITLLDSPPAENPRLKQLLGHKAPWE